MHKLNILTLSAVLATTSGCASLGLKSVPWPTNVAIHNRDAVDFLRSAPAVDGDLGEGLKTKDMLADGRLVGLAVSGGGARAAAFTLGVLTELQELQVSDGSNLLDRIDFISSNSGGSWAVAAYLSDRASRGGGAYRLEERVETRFIPAFDAMSKGRVPCWSGAMRDSLFGKQTYGEVYSASNPEPLPRAFFNASLLPAHAPFVFNDAFLEHYQVDQLGACGNDDWIPKGTRLANLPFGYAAAVSGTVPGFYHAYASTRLCSGPVKSTSFCASGRNYLRLADGGLYDNIGYKTAYELMLAQKQAGGARKAMILVNSNTSTDFKTVTPSERDDTFLATTAANGVFAVQDSTLERLYAPMFQSLGVEGPVLLDFYSTAKFRQDQAPLLEGLDALAHFAAHRVSCYSGGKLLPPDRKTSQVPLPAPAESVRDLMRKRGDCLSENFYRAGTLGKTTYKFQPAMFKILWQLGRLSVRMNCDKILAATGDRAPDKCRGSRT